MKQVFVIFNQSKNAYVSGPNALDRSVTKAKKFFSLRAAHRECAVGETPKRVN
jgi:hypothetical protein